MSSSVSLIERKGEAIRFFDIWGSAVQSGTQWYLQNVTNGREQIAPPVDVSAQIETVIMGDYAVRKGMRINAITIKPQKAVGLVLQGILTDEMISAAIIDGETITFLQVPFKKDGRTRLFRLVVEKMAPQAPAIMTVDAKGKTIKGEVFGKKIEAPASAA